MKIALRVIACVIAVAAIETAVLVAQIALLGGIGPLIRSGGLGITTIAAWLVVLAAGPVAAIQLWRLRRGGLFLALILCGIASAYYMAGLLFLRVPDAPLTPVVVVVVINGLVLSLLLSPAARRAVS
jgi:hypothetical protein